MLSSPRAGIAELGVTAEPHLSVTHSGGSARRGKAPPVDTYSGETNFEDLPALQRSSKWNVWSDEETLRHLRTGARLDIAANGVWGGTFERTYFDVRVFNPHAPSNRQTNLQSVYRKHEKIKKRAYEAGPSVSHGGTLLPVESASVLSSPRAGIAELGVTAEPHLSVTHSGGSARRGKAPPVDTYSGETNFEDLPALQRSSKWNVWSDEETLRHLRTGARLDIAANGVWGGTFERTYFDVRVFNPHAPSNRQTNLQSVYRKHEKIKKRAYEQRIREIEHATFSPLVLSATCGLAMEANTFYKRLASMLASKWDHNYSSTLCWLRCRLAFSLLRSSIQAIRGARSSCGHAIRMSTAVDLINSESRLSSH